LGGSKDIRQRHLEALLNLLEHTLVVLATDERDAETLGTEAPSTTDTMEI
jgi:hypothetical protein